MTTITTLLQQSCERHPEKAALSHKVAGKWQQTTYRELWHDAGQVASGLHGHGHKAGSHCAILAPPSPRWLISYIGIHRAGGVVVPIDKDLKAGELKHVLLDCEAQVVFTTESYLEVLLEIWEDLPRLENIVLIDQNIAEGRAVATISALADEWRRLVRKHRFPQEEVARLEGLAKQAHDLLTADKPSAQTATLPAATVSGTVQPQTRKGKLLSWDEAKDGPPCPPTPQAPGDLALLLYTSGTTGRSKGAMLSHGNIVSNIEAVSQRFNLDSSMRTLSFLPINHVFEQVCGILLPLSLGGTVCFAESLKKLADNLAELRPTFFLGVPAVYRIFYDRIRKKIDTAGLSRTLFAFPPTRPLVASKVRQSLGSGTTFISGGAALDPAIARGFSELGIELLQGYGITETSPVISAEPPGATRIGTVGPPIEGVSVKIDSPDAEGVGEILVKGPNVMQGYFKNPRATAEVLTEGWYATGDLGRFDEEGYLVICGRVKNLIVTPNGKNVYPEEVENQLLKSPYIAEAMVYGHHLDSGAEEVHAMVYPDQEAVDRYGERKGLQPMGLKDVESLIRGEVMAAGKQLADYKRVKKFTLREDEFPKTTTRKIKRFAVEAQVATES